MRLAVIFVMMRGKAELNVEATRVVAKGKRIGDGSKSGEFAAFVLHLRDLFANVTEGAQ